jgi:hypothetical protein
MRTFRRLDLAGGLEFVYLNFSLAMDNRDYTFMAHQSTSQSQQISMIFLGGISCKEHLNLSVEIYFQNIRLITIDTLVHIYGNSIVSYCA